jgi:hypothetical protein
VSSIRKATAQKFESLRAQRLGHPARPPGPAEAPLDAVYEAALRATLQVLVPQG